jgi:transglutaminase-like putative cysteine protease
VSIHVALGHITHCKYDRLLTLGPQVVRLRPAPHSRTKVLSYSLTIEPTGHFMNWQQDPFANCQARRVFPEAARSLKVTVDLVAAMAVFNPFDFFLEPQAEVFTFKYSAAQALELAPIESLRQPRRCCNSTLTASTSRRAGRIIFWST